MKQILSKQALLSLLIIGGTIILSLLLYWTRPSPAKGESVQKPSLVATIEVEKTDQPVLVTAYGTVQESNREVMLRAEVSGRVIEQSPNLVIGGLVKKGEVLLRLDPRDYLIQIEQQKALLEKAKFDLQVEEGRQVIAKREWEQLTPSIKTIDISEELALRKPHLREKKAALEAAKSQLEKAKIDYQRTTIRSPMDAIVISEAVEPGDYITPQSDIAQIVASGEFRVKVSVPVDKLKWIDQPDTKISVIQELGAGQVIKRQGEILRILGDLDPSGRMARILVAVRDPLGIVNPQFKKTPLLLGSYVKVEFQGSNLENVFKVPREALREDRNVWIKTNDDVLSILPVHILFRHEDFVYIDEGLNDGDKIIISPIPIAIPGMKVEEVEP